MGSSETKLSANIEDLNSRPYELLRRQIITYFENQKVQTTEHPQPRPFTLTGLAMALGVTLKDLLLYPHDGPHASLLENAKGRCEADLIERMYNKSMDRSTGMLLLKNHFGYIDIQKALTEEERKKKKLEEKISGKRSISDILDDIEKRNGR
jgi:hypothetical protein